MAGDELVGGLAVAVLPPALGQHVFLLRFQHRKPPDFFKISSKTALGGHDRQSRSSGHDSALHSCCPRITRQAICTTAPRADGASCCDRGIPPTAVQHYTKTIGAKGREAPSHRRDPSIAFSPRPHKPLIK